MVKDSKPHPIDNGSSVFDFEGYQVVRSPLFSSRPECPCISVTDDRITFNVFCLRKFAGVKYVQLLLHPSERKLAIRPCRPGDMHHIRWRVDPDKPFTPKTISCPHFGNALFQIMNWNPDFLYQIRGSWAARARDEIIVFSLPNAFPAALIEFESEDEECKRRRVYMCPDEWRDNFGEEFYDYAIDNSFFFLAPKTEWKADSQSIAVPGLQQVTLKTEDELGFSIDLIKQRVGGYGNE